MTKRSKAVLESGRPLLSELRGFYKRRRRLCIILACPLMAFVISSAIWSLQRRVSDEVMELIFAVGLFVGFFLLILAARREKRIRQKGEEEQLS